MNRIDLEYELSVRDGYAAWAPLYDGDGNPLIALEGPALQQWFGELNGLRALDIGCGTGRHTVALVEAGAQVTALDPSPEMLAIAQRKLADAPVNWLEHALPDRMPLATESFDLAVMGLVAEHLLDLETALIEVARVLKPGGRLLLSALHPSRTANGECARFIDPSTGRRRPIETYHRTVEQYLAAATRAGLELIEERTPIVDQQSIVQSPRAKRYLGQPLGWAAVWSSTQSNQDARKPS